ncbi:hypothetical protein ABBQ38_008295 [Trebouxia sp. C0009 RCD-2024]
MPMCGSPVVKQVCNTSICVLARAARLWRTRSFCTRSLEMSTAKYALVRDSRPVPCSSPADLWLKAAPRGAYTTARTFEQDKVFELTAHINRLASSCQQMLQHDSQEDGKQHSAEVDQLSDASQLRPRVVSSLKAAVQQFRQASPQHEGELKLTVLVTWETGKGVIHSHVAALPPRPKPPVKVQARGAPRQNATAKDSEWVRTRQALEKDKPPDVNEILLVTEQGNVLEGTQTNFFAVMDGAVYTARDGVLLGTVRGVLLEVCDREGIQVVSEPPSIHSIDSWQGAAIASTSRLFLPVHSLEYQTRQGETKNKSFDYSDPQHLFTKLEQLVLAEVARRSEELL